MKNILLLAMFLLSSLLLGCAPKDGAPIVSDRSLNEESSLQKSGHRQGYRPETTDAPLNTNIAHQQTTQNSPIELQEALREYMSGLPGVIAGPTKISVGGARAIFIPGSSGPTLAGDEWLHLHPPHDGSLHIALDKETMKELVDTGWGEYHPRNSNSIMLYGPRNKQELEYIQSIISKGLSLHKKEVEVDQQKKQRIPYSLEALQEVAFSGSGLSLEVIENETVTYTRYRIFYFSNGYRVSGILNIPKGEGPFPLLILNHGYIDPDVYTVGRGLKREQDYFARQGYAVLHTDYRNHGLSDDDEILLQNYIFRNYFYAQDAINAILAVQESSLEVLNSIDATNVGMLGHSMGGGVTMHAMIARPDLIKAGVLYAPVHTSEWYNFDRWRFNDLSAEEREERKSRLGSLDIDGFMPYSVTPKADEIASPLQIYFGTDDESVPYQRGLEIQSILTGAGVMSELITYEGEKHEFIRERVSFMEGATLFFDNELKSS